MTSPASKLSVDILKEKILQKHEIFVRILSSSSKGSGLVLISSASSQSSGESAHKCIYEQT